MFSELHPHNIQVLHSALPSKVQVRIKVLQLWLPLHWTCCPAFHPKLLDQNYSHFALLYAGRIGGPWDEEVGVEELLFFSLLC